MARHRGKGYCNICEKRVQFMIKDLSKDWDDELNRWCPFCLDRKIKAKKQKYTKK